MHLKILGFIFVFFGTYLNPSPHVILCWIFKCLWREDFKILWQRSHSMLSTVFGTVLFLIVSLVPSIFLKYPLLQEISCLLKLFFDIPSWQMEHSSLISSSWLFLCLHRFLRVTYKDDSDHVFSQGIHLREIHAWVAPNFTKGVKGQNCHILLNSDHKVWYMS